MSWFAYAIGAFYIFAGVVVMRALAMERLLDRAISAIGGTAPDPVDARRLTILTVGAILTLASGVSLAVLSPFASVFFLANVVVQGGYLLWAEKAVPLESPAEERGRRQTKNAFVIFTAATAFVLWLQWQGHLRPWSADIATHTLDLGVVSAAVLAVWAWLYMPRPQSTAAKPPTIADEPLPESRMPQRLRFAADWQCWPLWDADTGDNVNPYEIGLPLELIERIEVWDARWQATYNGDDPAASGYQSEADQKTYRDEGRAIAAELKAAWSGEVEVAAMFQEEP